MSNGETLGRSISRTTTESTRRFPSLDDFVEQLRSAGEIASLDELLEERHDLLSAIFHAWTQRGQVGCQFAIHLAKHHEEAGWLEAVLSDIDPDDVDALLRGPGTKNGIEAVLLVLPHVRQLSDLTEVIAVLCQSEAFCWEEIPGTDEDHFLVGLRWRAPKDNALSWVLAFGDFPEFPFTRRSPIPALTVRAKGPPNKYGGLDLARMNPLADAAHCKAFDELTSKNRALLLDGELEEVARARVTTRLPRSHRQLLPPAGC